MWKMWLSDKFCLFLDGKGLMLITLFFTSDPYLQGVSWWYLWPNAANLASGKIVAKVPKNVKNVAFRQFTYMNWYACWHED